MKNGSVTSWESSSVWYNQIVSHGGHYYHQHVVIPQSLSLLKIDSSSKILDLACGQGVLGRSINPQNTYLGIDLSPSLISTAKKLDRSPHHSYHIGDVTKPLNLNQIFSHAAIILALQNIDQSQAVFANASRLLATTGKFLVVINHPCFRIPRQSGWGQNPDTKTQYRFVNRYLQPLKIPILTHPGQKKSPITWSYHLALSTYSEQLRQAGFIVETIEEWTSGRVSRGTRAKSENIARHEIPLFMALLCRKLSFDN